MQAAAAPGAGDDSSDSSDGGGRLLLLKHAKAAALQSAGRDWRRAPSGSPPTTRSQSSPITTRSQASFGSVLHARLKDAGGPLQKRRIFALMAFLGLFEVYAMRMDLSQAADSMQKKYGWSNEEQGYVLSSFFWGYVAFQVPGALMAQRWGGKHVFGVGILGTSVLTLLLPACAGRLWLLCLLRALMGLCESVTYPALNTLYTFWVPCTERATLIAFMTSGAMLGTAAALPIAGVLISLHKDADDVSTTWPWAFYAFGASGCVWFVFWEWLVAGAPEQHTTITAEERRYIEATTREDADTVIDKVEVTRSERAPWLAFLSHPAAWALHINLFCSAYGNYTLMTYLPKFLDEELGFDIKNSGFIGSLPYVLQGTFGILSGVISDHMTLLMPVRRVRIITVLVLYVCAGGLLLLTGFITESRAAAVAAVTASIAFSGLFAGGISPNIQDLSPHWTGQLLSVTNTIGNFAGVLAPIVAGDLLGSTAPRSPGLGLPPAPVAVPDANWRHVFYVAAALYAFAGVVWVSLMRAKPVQALN